MSTEKEKMIAGERYNASDPELVSERVRARMLCQQLAALDINAPSRERAALRAKLFGAETDVYITPPFFCDYGYNISLGTNVYFNFNCVVLDGRAVSIGNNCLVGPAVQIYTASHPLSGADRRMGTEFGQPVEIGPDVWIGGGAIICPGVVIGSGCVIGAGSVVTRDIPANVLAAGNPCGVIRKL